MSKGLDDRVSFSHWTYTASVMSRHLGEVIESWKMNPGGLLRGVHWDAIQFFDFALKDAERWPSAGQPSNMQAYARAGEVLGFPGIKKEQLDKKLSEFKTLLQLLDGERLVTESELLVACELRKFFEEVAERGNEENHTEAGL